MPLTLDISDHIATITLDNPPLNLWEPEWYQQLEDIADSFRENKDVRVAIITGAGERAFTAGHNRKVPLRMRKRDVRNYLQALIDCAVPLIGAINGFALGHGIAISSACDILIGSENASFGLPEVDTGGANGGRMMMQMFPRGHVRYSVYTGERIGAAEAYRVGALFKVVPPAELMPEARKLAATIAAKTPVGIRSFKNTLRWVEYMDLQTGYEYEGDQHTLLFLGTPAGQKQADEARISFLEKRKPNFEGLE
jgi:enoyl-CoA hydratase